MRPFATLPAGSPAGARRPPPCVIHEDDDLLVVAKPAGWNTHAPAPYAGEGIYEWLRHREPRWSSLAIVHRLDRDTSGVLVFARTPAASKSLTEQFTRREIRKRYLLLTDGTPPRAPLRVESSLVRSGTGYAARPPAPGSGNAVTVFTPAGNPPRLVIAEPLTGRTHQVRVQAAMQGFAVRGDKLYGGGEAPRLCLHAEQITLRHPGSAAVVTYGVAADFDAEPGAALRAAFIDPQDTNALRLIHGAADGWPGCYVDRLADTLLIHSEATPDRALEDQLIATGARALYRKQLSRQVRRLAPEQASPVLLAGAKSDDLIVLENGVRYGLTLEEGYSYGLFLDQRDNRRRLLVNHVGDGFTPLAGGGAGREVLNAFAYTCGFSVCAALAGARVTSLDLSRKYLDWGRRNFELNGLDPAGHDFIYGDAFDWLRWLTKKQRRFDLIVLDPPTFSHSRAAGAFRAEHDYGRLATTALPLLAPGGVLLACANVARLRPEVFRETLHAAIEAAGRRIGQEFFAPQPPDFPVTREEPAHLKSFWLRVQ